MSVIVVDDAIAYADVALAEFGSLQRLPAAAITSERLAALAPEALIVRSVTRIDEALLRRVPSLRFVGTATAGVDHVDLDALARRGITWASAAGCNAQAVAEWVVAALQVAAPSLPGPVGVVGFGNVGTRLTRLLRRLGYEVLVCDPPRARAADCDEPLLAFEELWARCSILSFHVPLILDGPDATVAYVDVDRPARGPTKLLINTSRGAVLPDRALDRPDVGALILDVWDGEPQLAWPRLDDPRLLLASPHVAGYSLEAKVMGTRMMHDALARAHGCAPSWTGAEWLVPCSLDGPLTGFASVAAVLGRVVDLAGDDARVRALVNEREAARGPAFEALRRGYRLRREFAAWALNERIAAEQRGWLLAAGFRAN